MEHWIRTELRRREDRVDREEFAMALFSVRGDGRRARELRRDLSDGPRGWRELAREARR